jgi:hypothetical protein
MGPRTDAWVRGPVTSRISPPRGDSGPPPTAGTAGVRPVPPQPQTPDCSGRRKAAEGAGTAVAPGAVSAVSWVGAHGGAGATTFAAALGGQDVGHGWPRPAEGHPGRMVLLARTHATGLRAASRALDALRAGRLPAGVELVALVLVADAPGRLPLELARRVRVLRSAAPIVSIPWIPQWRVGAAAPRAPKAVADLRELIGSVRSLPEGAR